MSIEIARVVPVRSPIETVTVYSITGSKMEVTPVGDGVRFSVWTPTQFSVSRGEMTRINRVVLPGDIRVFADALRELADQVERG